MTVEKSKLKCEYFNGAYSELAAVLGVANVLILHAAFMSGTQR